MRGVTVTKELVHKSTDDAVMLSTVERLSESRFRVPLRPHARRGGASGGASSGAMIGLEVVRQLGLLMGHYAGSVPLDWAFLLQELTFTATADGPNAVFPREFETNAVVSISSRDVRKGNLVGMTAEVEILSDDDTVALGGGRFRCVPRQTYQALRRHAAIQTASAIPPTKSTLVDPACTSSKLTATLGWPSDDELLFDHDVDHVPGMLLAQAGVVAHETMTGVVPRSIYLTCARFAEIGVEAAVVAQHWDRRVSTLIQQGGTRIARIETV